MVMPFPGITKNPRYHADDATELFGSGGTVKLLYETADPNANHLNLVFPEGGAVDVPVLVLGDVSIDNVDLTWFNGVTEPTIAVVNDVADAYISLDAGDDAVAGSKGLYFKSAADEDIELLNLSVTGSPRLFWDESESSLSLNVGLIVTSLALAATSFIAGTGDNSYIRITGGSTPDSAGVGALLNLFGTSHGEAGKFTLYTPTAAGADGLRLAISGNLATSVATWSSVTHSGLDITSGEVLKVAGTQVVGAQGAAVADVSDGLLATTITQLNALLARVRTHGLIAT